MKILYLVSDHKHCHDYGIDFLYDGFCRVLGFDNVYDYPEKRSLHLTEERDSCNIDSDQWWPKKNASIKDIIDEVELVFIAYNIVGSESLHRDLISAIPSHIPIIALDMSDRIFNDREVYTQVVGRPLLAYFKREFPIKENWDAIPLPLCYPQKRIDGIVPTPFPVDGIAKEAKVFYHATTHGNGDPGKPRIYFIDELKKRLSPYQLDVGLYRGQEKGTRLDPEEYHERMAKCLVSICWNGTERSENNNWDNNRIWESFAHGMCIVTETPRIRIPNCPEDRKHWLCANSPEEVVNLVCSFITFGNDSREAFNIAQQGLLHFRRYHSSEARVHYILNHLGFKEYSVPLVNI